MQKFIQNKFRRVRISSIDSTSSVVSVSSSEENNDNITKPSIICKVCSYMKRKATALSRLLKGALWKKSQGKRTEKDTLIKKSLPKKNVVIKTSLNARIYRCNTIRKLIDDLWKNSSGSGGSSKSSINNINNIEKEHFKDSSGGSEGEGDEGYVVGNKIVLMKNTDAMIGSYGAIYNTIINDKLQNILTKVMSADKENILETKIMSSITEDIIMKRKSKHFIIMYYHSLCQRNIYTKYAIANYNEATIGDISKLFMNYPSIVNRDDTLYNIVIQIFLSIGSFHNITGYIHNDCHLGNFLYLNNTEYNTRGYYQYVFKCDDGVLEYFYLKSCKYNIMIYDFGLAKHIRNYDKEYILHRIENPHIPDPKDFNVKADTMFDPVKKIKFEYLRILTLIILRKYPTMKTITHIERYNAKKLVDIWYILSEYNEDHYNGYRNLKQIFYYVINICLANFNTLFTNYLPRGCYAINDIPYELSNDTKLAILDNK